MIKYRKNQNGDNMSENINKQNKKRIWELDALRGIFVLGMIIVHIVFDLENFTMIKMPKIQVLSFIKEYGFIGFLLISGVCAPLSRNNAKRGFIVLSVAVFFTSATYLLYFLDFFSKGYTITFGILHLIGVSMLTYPLYKKMPPILTAVIGLFIIVLGVYFLSFRIEMPYLFPLGLRTKSYAAGDYYPIFPYMGVFVLGTTLGRHIYREKKSLLPHAEKYFSFLSVVGRNALIIYIVHQPIIYLALKLFF